MDKILVVDDEADIRRAFRRNLEPDGLTVLEAGSGPEAIRQIAAEKPDLVVMDIRMGASNGLETLKKLRVLDPKLLVIMMTDSEHPGYFIHIYFGKNYLLFNTKSIGFLFPQKIYQIIL